MWDDLFRSPNFHLASKHWFSRFAYHFCQVWFTERIQCIYFAWTPSALYKTTDNSQPIPIMTLWPKSLVFHWTNAFDTFVAIPITNNATTIVLNSVQFAIRRKCEEQFYQFCWHENFVAICNTQDLRGERIHRFYSVDFRDDVKIY